MQINLNFWKYEDEMYINNDYVYVTACCEGKEVEGLLEQLPITEIMNRLKTEFSSWAFIASDTFDGSERGSFKIFTTSQIVRFDCYDMSHNDIHLLRDIMWDFDCPLYDPLTSFRFDGYSAMSNEFCFWKYKEGVYLDNQQVYVKSCCEGKEVEGLEQLPITEIMNRLKTEFSSWAFVAPDTFNGDKCGSFKIFTTSQAVRLNCYDMSGYDMNLLMDIMLTFECPVYDPTNAVRFDGKS